MARSTTVRTARRQRLQLQDQRPRQQRGDHRERRVLGGGRDQQHDPVLHRGQQRVLLGLGEPVHLVDEQHGLFAVRGGAPGHIDDGAHLFDPGRQRRERLEPPTGGLRDQRGQRGLTGTGRPVEDHRRGTRAVDQPAQRRARPQQMVLPDDLVEGSPAASAPPAAPTRRPEGPRPRSAFARARRTDRRTRTLLTTPLGGHDQDAVHARLTGCVTKSMSSSTRPISAGSRSFQSRTRDRMRCHARAMSA